MQFQAMMIYVAMLLFVILLFVTQDADAVGAQANAGAGIAIGDEETLSDALQRTAEELKKW